MSVTHQQADPCNDSRAKQSDLLLSPVVDMLEKVHSDDDGTLTSCLTDTLWFLNSSFIVHEMLLLLLSLDDINVSPKVRLSSVRVLSSRL